MMKVAVIATVLNEEKSISLLLSALQKQTLSPDEVIIVDGGSSDGTWEKLQAASKHNTWLKVYAKSGNRSVGRNEAIKLSTVEVIAITDAGCIPHDNWLEELVKAYEQNKIPVIAGYYDARPQTPFQEAVVPYVLVMPDRVNPDEFLPATRSMLIEKQAWKSVGGFDETLSDNEDFAFAHALKDRGSKMAFAPNAKVRWLPTKKLSAFFWMIFRFARGDIQAGIVRPNVVFLFARYILLLCLVLLLILLQQGSLLMLLLLIGFIAYSLWAINKNKKYVPRGWYWLPVLQYVADVAVMSGSVKGLLMRKH